jgi:uncharacterized membrane protein AbrB (regulator of aidB expression)
VNPLSFRNYAVSRANEFDFWRVGVTTGTKLTVAVVRQLVNLLVTVVFVTVVALLPLCAVAESFTHSSHLTWVNRPVLPPFPQVGASVR